MPGVLRAKVGGQWVDISLSGPAGPQGPSGGDFRFVQATPSAVWTIEHGLAFDPSVTVIDSSGAQVEGDVVHTGSTVVVTFSAAFSGTAILS